MSKTPFQYPPQSDLRTWKDVATQIADVLTEKKEPAKKSFVSPFGLREGGYFEQLEQISQRT